MGFPLRYILRYILRGTHVKKLILGALALMAPAYACAADVPANTYDWTTNWPTHYVFANGTDVGLAGKYQFDLDRFSNDGGRFEDAQTNRRKEVGFYVRRKGVYEATAVYDNQAKTWLDVFLRLQTKGLIGVDLGAFRFGHTKTLVGFEGQTGTGSTTFLEIALPVQAIYAGRRTGVDWMLLRPGWFLNVGYYWAGDLQGDSDGHMTAARFALTPRNAAGDVLHLGISASRETPDGTRDGRGRWNPPSARLRSRPETGLLDQRLVDSGVLAHADHTDRRGVEFLRIAGPLAAKAEYLDARVTLNGRPAYVAHGWYAFGTWVVTGESRTYTGGNLFDAVPKSPWGALEFALRYSTLDLDDGPTQGGTEHDWTLGANWYINKYLKLQANYIRATSDRGDLRVDPRIVEVRAQIMF